MLMPRKARIDAPGAVHHIIVRGIDRRQILGNRKVLGERRKMVGK